MTRPRVYKTEAIVLKRVRLREADDILTLYTPHMGKLRAVAKGVRRPKSKLGGHVELLNHSLMMLAQGKNLDIVTQSQTIDSFLPLRTDLWRTSCALYVAELIDRFAAEKVENYPAYKLLLNTLGWLCQARSLDLVLRYFELHLVDYMGYRPQLQRCVGCDRQLEPASSFFSASAGGMLCTNCSYQEPSTRLLSLNALKVLRLLQGGDWAVARRLRLRAELSLELEEAMRGYIRYLLEREVKSAAWLDRLRREGKGLGVSALQ